MASASNRSSNLLFAAVTVGVIVSAFLLTNALPFGPVLSTNDVSGSAVGDGDSSKGDTSGMCLSAEGTHELDYTPVFEIFGVTYTSYIRGAVGELYENGGWSPEPNSPVATYSGSVISNDIPSYSSKTLSIVTINPLPTFYGGVPALVYTNKILFYMPISAFYYSDLQVFTIDGSYESTYDIESTHYSFNADLLREIQVSQTAFVNTQVPSSLKSCLDFILGQIDFSHTRSAYDRIVAIQSYLRSNYVYDLNYQNAPSNVDPIQWFLLTEKRGVCANFNSAFAMLLRESGIPARVVGGYSIEGSEDYQVVRAYQAHQWVEVKFENVGWVEFDATGSGQLPAPPALVETRTEITSLSSSAVKGGQFQTAGTVTDLAGHPVSGLDVEIYLKTDKASPQALGCGSGTTLNDGTFSIASNIPVAFQVGNYQVVAKTLGSDAYLGSQSDPALTVNSQTEIKPTADSQALIGKPFTLSAQLTEAFTSVPLPDQTLRLSYNDGGQEKQIVAVTNQSGYASLSFASIPKTNDNKLNYSITFNQNGFYLATAVLGQLTLISLEVNPSVSPSQNVDDATNASTFFGSPIFFSLIALVSVVSIGIIAIVLKKRKQPEQKLTTPEITNVPPPIVTGARKSFDVSILINFLQIQHPFPDLWGVNELITAQFLLTKKELPLSGEIEIHIGDETEKKVKTNAEGVALFDFKVPTKGTIKIVAKYIQGNKTVTGSRFLKVVDYTEEIVAIFKDMFDLGKGRGLRMNKDTSPREFQRLLLSASNQQDDLSLDCFVTIFEVADYSLRSLNRSDYEKMFLSSLSIKQLLSENARYDG